MQDFTGKVALITGGGGGIGGSLGRALAQRGMKVALADRDIDRAAVNAASLGTADTLALELDVRDPDSWSAARSQVEASLGPVALLVNNAGIGSSGPVAEEDPLRWKAVLEVNAYGSFLGSRTFLPSMLESGAPSHILFVASLAGLHPTPTLSAYTASKYAVVGLAECLRGELAGTNVGVSVAYPGGVQTEFSANSAANLAVDGLTKRSTTDTSAILRQGMHPDALAAVIAQGIAAGDFHIFSHGGWRERLETHFGGRLEAYGEESRFKSADDAAILVEAVNRGLQ